LSRVIRYTSHIILVILSFSVCAQIKQYKYYYDGDSTRIKEIFHYSLEDSTLHGSYESFFSNGSLQIFGWYIHNEPDSIWKYYYENGRPKAEGRYRKGKANGKWKYYYENGNIKSEGILNGPEKEGFWTFYYENGGEKSNGNYFSSQKSGIWNYFYEDESLKAQSYLEQGKGRYTEFYPSGKRRMEGYNANEKSVGEWIYYYESGEVEASGFFNDGLKTGAWTYYHKNGLTAAVGNYKKGLRIGDWIYYHENGKVSQEGKIVEDQKDGYWKLFYPTGEILGEANFKTGSGDYNEYYPSGSRKAKGQLEDGKKTGKWYYYNEDGALEGEADFLEDKGEYTGYYPNGTMKMQGDLDKDKRVGEWTLYNDDGSKAGSYHPIYEDEKPIFKSRVSQDDTRKEDFSTPEYRFKRRGFKYFQPTINEYRGVIIGTNPIWLYFGRLPIAIEYYIQERLGYEIQVDIIRDPFFTGDSKVDDGQVFERGVNFHLRQKFYNSDSPNGMFYFGHELTLRITDHRVNHLDINSPRFSGSISQSGPGYGIFIGNRWMKEAGNSGWTVDVFAGVGIATRYYRKNYSGKVAREVQILDGYLEDEIYPRVYFPLQIGLNIGLVGPKSKSKTQ